MTEPGSDSPPIPYGRQSLNEDDVAAVVRVLRSDWLTTGPAVEAFEAALARRGGAAHAVAVSSGTAALHTGYAAAGLASGDEVITTPLSFVATASAALMQGAAVKFADVDPRTGTIDVEHVAALLTPHTRLIVAVDYAGHPADYDSLRRLAGSGPRLIADAAHSLGASYRGRPVGSLADATALSFHPVKSITTGEGGAILTDDGALAGAARRFRNHGIVRERAAAPAEPSAGAATRDAPWPAWYYEVHSLGCNYRLPDILCALGLSQLERLDAFIDRRRAIAQRYRAAMAGFRGIEQPFERDDVRSSWHLYVLRVLESARRDAFFDRLRALGLGTQVHYRPLHLQPIFAARGYRRGAYPIAEAFASRALSIPLYPGMTDGDVDRVISTVERACREVL
jgi:UDP-4-amino-4,6-dideoxy-N-acetyl-beta-L-altrosamine transaminase